MPRTHRGDGGRRSPRRCWTRPTSCASGSCSPSSAARRAQRPRDVPAGAGRPPARGSPRCSPESPPTLTATAVELLTTYAIAAADGLFIANEIGGDSVDLMRLFELHARALYDTLTRLTAGGRPATEAP